MVISNKTSLAEHKEPIALGWNHLRSEPLIFAIQESLHNVVVLGFLGVLRDV